MKNTARLIGAVAMLFSSAAFAQAAICYNCPPEWADWGTQLKVIKEKTGVTVPQDNKNSGQSLAQLVAEKASPVADITYLGVTFGIQAKKEGVVTPYKPAHFDDLRRVIVEGSVKPKPRHQFNEGDEVRVVVGAFANFSGTVQEVNPDKQKLKVMVSIFGRPTPVELDFSHVEKR